MRGRQVKPLVLVRVVAILLIAWCIASLGSTRSSPEPGEASVLVDNTTVGSSAGQQDQPIGRATSDDQGKVAEGDWPMAGANPQRTSWTPEEVRGELDPAWYRPIEPFIPPKVQIIAANGLLYVSTAKGLYALDAETGAEAWVYPTELPLGHSPTIHDGVAYVGGFDRRIHAIDAITGEGLWTFDGAGAGFSTNPLVVDGLVYMGNRDGVMYAVGAHGTSDQGQLVWQYETDGAILFSAAYQDGVVYFASNDSYAYALDAQTGQLVWRSPKLPAGDGFHSWWPVITGDVVIFSGSRGYRPFIPPQTDWATQSLTKGDVGLWDDDEPDGTPLGPLLPGGYMDAARALEYLEEMPWRRSFYLLDLNSGREITYDLDNDGRSEYAPLLNTGTNSGNRYPPVIGSDGTIYTFNHYFKRYGHVSGWRLGSSSFVIPSSRWTARDEPLAYSAGGNVIYWNHCCDRSAGAFDAGGGQDWIYFQHPLSSLIPGYDIMTMGTYESNAVRVYGGWNGVYGYVGDQNPPIPYQGRVYMHRSNAVIAWSPEGGVHSLPLATIVTVSRTLQPVDVASLRQKLIVETRKIIDAGHLRPGYGVQGTIGRSLVGDNLTDYWHNPLDTIYVLTRAVPHLPLDLQQELMTYIQGEYASYLPYQYTHIGWRDGAAREAFDLPPEVEEDCVNWPATMYSTHDFEGWTGPSWKWTPHTFYALWEYAQLFGGAKEIFDNSKERLWSTPDDAVLAEYPFVHNAYIAGYLGYLELERLAGYPESAGVRAELDRLFALRVANFTKDNPWGPDAHYRGQVLSVARNFMFLAPELGEYLRDNAFRKAQQAFVEYNRVAPYWSVTKFEATYREAVMHHLYDYRAMFAAKAYIFQEPREELVKYLDVPAFARGDLFYIENLIDTIEAPSHFGKTPSQSSAYQGETVTYTLSFFGSGNTLVITDSLPVGVSGPLMFDVEGTNVLPVYNAYEHTLAWTDSPATEKAVKIHYSVNVASGEPEVLVNVADLCDENGRTSTATAVIIANPYRAFLPLVFKRSQP